MLYKLVHKFCKMHKMCSIMENTCNGNGVKPHSLNSICRD